MDSKLNSNENSNLRLGSVPASHPKVPRVELGKPTLGEGINTNIPGVHTELGEVFMNSSHDKLLGLTGEGIGRLMKQPEEVESTRDELDDFFDTAQPPLDLFPKDKAKQLRLLRKRSLRVSFIYHNNNTMSYVYAQVRRQGDFSSGKEAQVTFVPEGSPCSHKKWRQPIRVWQSGQ